MRRRYPKSGGVKSEVVHVCSNGRLLKSAVVESFSGDVVAPAKPTASLSHSPLATARTQTTIDNQKQTAACSPIDDPHICRALKTIPDRCWPMVELILASR